MGKNMSPKQAQALAEKYQARYPDASPREIAAIVNDPTQHFNEPILGGMYRGFKVPSNMKTEQSDAWRAAVDQRMEGFGGREAARRDEERRRLNEEIRSNIAGVVKPASLAASVTPYDLGLGDVGYAAGELIDPEGTYGDAALAAAGGVLTGGVGSGALMTKAAKEARKGIKRADDVEDLIPTKIGPTPGGFQSGAGRAAREYTESLRNPPPIDPSMIQKQMRTRFSNPPPELAIGIGGAAAIGALGKERLRELQEAEPAWDRDRTFQAYDPEAEPVYKESAIAQALQAAGTLPTAGVTLRELGTLLDMSDLEGLALRQRRAARRAGVPDEVSMSDWHATGRASDMPTEYYDSDAPYKSGTGLRRPANPNLSVAMMNEVRKTTDYGRGFAETTERHSPSNFSSADRFSDLPSEYQSNRDAAIRIFEQTGKVPSGLARSLGKYEALMNTRAALLSEDDRMVREGIALQPSTPIVEPPSERPMMAGPGSTVPDVEEREIEPSMGYFGE